MKRPMRAATLGVARFARFALAACAASARAEQITVTAEEWGGGRLFVLGEEIVPPLEFARIGVSDPPLVVNGTVIDPLPCPTAAGAPPEFVAIFGVRPPFTRFDRRSRTGRTPNEPTGGALEPHTGRPRSQETLP